MTPVLRQCPNFAADPKCFGATPEQSGVWQGWCWAHPWRTAAHFLMLAALLSACSGFGGLVVLHGYLAASNQTTYELSRGAKARASPHTQRMWHTWTC